MTAEVEQIALFIERQCPRRMFPGMKCSEYSCSIHWLAAQVRGGKHWDPNAGRDMLVTTDVIVDVMR